MARLFLALLCAGLTHSFNFRWAELECQREQPSTWMQASGAPGRLLEPGHHEGTARNNMNLMEIMCGLSLSQDMINRVLDTGCAPPTRRLPHQRARYLRMYLATLVNIHKLGESPQASTFPPALRVGSKVCLGWGVLRICMCTCSPSPSFMLLRPLCLFTFPRSSFSNSAQVCPFTTA